MAGASESATRLIDAVALGLISQSMVGRQLERAHDHPGVVARFSGAGHGAGPLCVDEDERLVAAAMSSVSTPASRRATRPLESSMEAEAAAGLRRGRRARRASRPRWPPRPPGSAVCGPVEDVAVRRTRTIGGVADREQREAEPTGQRGFDRRRESGSQRRPRRGWPRRPFGRADAHSKLRGTSARNRRSAPRMRTSWPTLSVAGFLLAEHAGGAAHERERNERDGQTTDEASGLHGTPCCPSRGHMSRVSWLDASQDGDEGYRLLAAVLGGGRLTTVKVVTVGADVAPADERWYWRRRYRSYRQVNRRRPCHAGAQTSRSSSPSIEMSVHVAPSGPAPTGSRR